MTKIGLFQFLLVFLVSAAYGQKVKYKDIYALLSTKQFEQAEPFLKQYLKENTDNPNAYLFMGNIYQEKSSNTDILKNTEIAIANMDSAIIFYDKAYKSIDDREVRKNKDYYANYNRRDLRTGEFGIKLSDIQFDIEKRMQALKEKIDRTKMTKHFFNLSSGSYQRANAQFVAIQSEHPSLNQVYLRANEETVKELTMLALRFDSCVRAFEQYKNSIAAVGKTGYNQKLTITGIADFKMDGRSGADFFADEVKVWDYKKFADESRAIIEKEILPMRAHLVTYDMEINKLRERLNADSVSVRNDLMKLVDRLLFDQLKKFDPQPLPAIVFGMKTTDLGYRSVLLEHKPLRDSADLHLQISLLTKELALLRQLDSTASLLPEEKFAEKSVDYADFVNSTYGNASSLKSYLRSLKDFGLRESKKKSTLLELYWKGLNYIVDGADSIPLSGDAVALFAPLSTSPEKYTVGIAMRDTTQLEGYFYTVAASRKPDVKAYFPLDKSSFRMKSVPSSRALSYSDPGGQVFYVLIYSENPLKDKFPATVAKIYRSDGLAWKADYPLTFVPSQLMLGADTGDLVITNGEQQFVLDKNGKVRN